LVELYPDQQADLANLRAAYHGGAQAPLFVAPTGYGKTVLFSFITSRMNARGKRITILAHRQELVDQISAALQQFSVLHGIVSPDHPHTMHPVQVASTMTLVRRHHQYVRPDLIVIDEAHHAVKGSTIATILGHYAGARLLGVTATPVRLDGTGLGQIFDRLVLGPTTDDLVRMGRLCGLRVYAPPTVDTRGLHTSMGDYLRSELAARVDKPTITGSAVLHYRKHCPGARAVVFCVSVEHAHNVAREFSAAGYPAVALDGTTDKTVRRGVIRDFQEGKTRLLASCDLISEGFDCPGIEAGISLRPTQSQGLWRQQVGRCLRSHLGKDQAVILDHCGNAVRLGIPGLSPEPVWSLEGTPKRKKEAGETGVRVCPQCFAAQAGGGSHCDHCGHTFALKPRSVAQSTGELAELSRAVLAVAFTTQRRTATSLQDLIALGRSRRMRYPEAWAQHVLRARQSKQRRSL
jgi:DNA repair protein RadD